MSTNHKTILAVAVASLCLGALLATRLELVAGTLATPAAVSHSFVSGTPAEADGVNQTFLDLVDQLEACAQRSTTTMPGPPAPRQRPFLSRRSTLARTSATYRT